MESRYRLSVADSGYETIYIVVEKQPGQPCVRVEFTSRKESDARKRLVELQKAEKEADRCG